MPKYQRFQQSAGALVSDKDIEQNVIVDFRAYVDEKKFGNLTVIFKGPCGSNLVELALWRDKYNPEKVNLFWHSFEKCGQVFYTTKIVPPKEGKTTKYVNPTEGAISKEQKWIIDQIILDCVAEAMKKPIKKAPAKKPVAEKPNDKPADEKSEKSSLEQETTA